MKRLTLSLLAGLALLAAPVAKADNINVEEASEAAAYFLQQYTNQKRITADQLTVVLQKENVELGVPSMYFFNTPECGWVIMAATTVMNPMVAYSGEGLFDAENMAPALVDWLNEYNQMVCGVQMIDAEQDLGDSQEWETLKYKKLMVKDAPAGNEVILMDENWDQGGPYPNNKRDYNVLCPIDPTTGYRCPVGCVATALAQICHHYQYPTNPRGFITDSWSGGSASINLDTMVPFDYSMMPNTIAPSTSVAKCREISRLGYYIGITVKMQYAWDGSSSTIPQMMNNFPYHFRFTNGTLTERSGNETLFFERLRGDLLRGRPVYMRGSSQGGTGSDAGGHAWVCDGYRTDDNNFYHMNWGWANSDNGFYNLVGNTYQDMYNSASGYCFRLDQGIVTGMIPQSGVGIEEEDVQASTGAPYPNPATYSVNVPYSTSNATTLTLYNALGQPVLTRNVQAGSGELTIRVDNMPKGVYIYRMGDAYGKLIVK